MSIVADALLVLIAAIVVTMYFIFASFAWGAGYQPTPRRIVERMLEFAEVGPDDLLYDLGAGTGAIVFRAARVRGARVVGVELEPIRILLLRLRQRLGRAADRITFVWGDIFAVDLRPATVVAVFLWPDAMERLRGRFETQLRPGTRVVSHWHRVPGWTAEREDRELKVYLYRWPQRGVATTATETRER